MTFPSEPPSLPIQWTPEQLALKEELAREAWAHEARVAMTRVALRDAGVTADVTPPEATNIGKFYLACGLLDAFAVSEEKTRVLLVAIADMLRYTAAAELFELLAEDPGPLEGYVPCACAEGCAFCKGRPVSPQDRRVARALVVFWALLPATLEVRRALFPEWTGQIVAEHLVPHERAAAYMN